MIVGTMSLLVCIGILVFVVFAEANGGQEMHLIMFDESNSDEYTVCNDGTRGGYYFAKASDPAQTNVWVVHLPGGGQCYDEQSCDTRSRDLMSSNHFESTVHVGGFLDKTPDKTPLWGANKAYLAYCSSDGYMGDVGASDATWGYHFRGQRLVSALFQALINDHNFNNATKVYLTGTSAGARGMMTQIDKLVSTKVPTSATVVGLLDSPYYLDIQPYSEDSKGFQHQEQQKYALYNTLRVISDDCAAAYPDTSEQWKCQFGQYRMPFVKTPYFVIASQYDSYQLEELTQSEPKEYSPETFRYTESFAQLDRTSMRSLSTTVVDPSGLRSGDGDSGDSAVREEKYPVEDVPVKRSFRQQTPRPGHSTPLAPLIAMQSTSGGQQLRQRPVGDCSTTKTADIAVEEIRAFTSPVAYSGGYGYFTWACYNHAVANTELFYRASTSEGVSQKEAFEAYLARIPEDVSVPSWAMSWTDDCVAFSCGQHCKG